MAPARARLGAGDALFEAFAASDSTPHFDADKLPPRKPLPSYNDGAVLSTTIALRALTWGDQLWGIIGNLPDASSTKELFLGALSAKLFLAREIPLPRSAVQAFDFLRK